MGCILVSIVMEGDISKDGHGESFYLLYKGNNIGAKNRIIISLEEAPNNLSRRIGEILDERKLTLRGFGRYVGMNKDIIWRIANGERYAKPSEVAQIAKSLKLPVDRLKMEDNKATRTEFQTLVRRKMNLLRAIDLGKDLFSHAIGYSERFEILHDLGAAYYFRYEQEKAREAWEESVFYAEKIYELFGETEKLFVGAFNLFFVHYERKEFLALERLLEQIEPAIYRSTPRRAGSMFLLNALFALEKGNLELFKMKVYESSDCYERTGEQRLIEMARNNVAFAELLCGNVFKSLSLFEDILANPHSFEELHLIRLKGYAQALLKAKKTSNAIQVIEDALTRLKSGDFQNIRAIFLLLHAQAAQVGESAQLVLAMEEIDSHLHLLACRFLIEYFKQRGSEGKQLEYYYLAEKLEGLGEVREEVCCL